MLVDDHAVVREGYRRLIEKQTDIAVIAEAADGRNT
jgi:two-component system, NarL family, invasion response regulator UvrY